MDSNGLWNRYREHLFVSEELGLRLDISRMRFTPDFFEDMQPRMLAALEAMAELESGAIANPDEGRMVGHYWLRAPELAPSLEVRREIEECVEAIKGFAGDVHEGRILPSQSPGYTDVLLIGIGGSALGPQFVADALGNPVSDRMRMHFFDNTDPDGMERTLRILEPNLASTLTVIVSKSGGTAETRNGMLTARAAFVAKGLDFSKQAVAVTGEGSALDQQAQDEGWLARFPMWDWVGGRTSELAAVGLLPAALQGLNIDRLLEGAAACDRQTRTRQVSNNPAALLALMWYWATRGQGEKDMVLLPYRDRLLLFSRYLQQLVMESLGKGTDLDGQSVAQGIAVYGNKGSTDQHAYVQQLREGVDNFFVTFIEVLAAGQDELEVEPETTAGDYLRGFMLGTRQALSEAGRESMTLTIDMLDCFSVGVLIALYERAVGLYAHLVNINAYHQPGVEAGKQAAAGILSLQASILASLREQAAPLTAEKIAATIGQASQVESVFQLLEGLAANGRINKVSTEDIFACAYRAL